METMRSDCVKVEEREQWERRRRREKGWEENREERRPEKELWRKARGKGNGQVETVNLLKSKYHREDSHEDKQKGGGGGMTEEGREEKLHSHDWGWKIDSEANNNSWTKRKEAKAHGKEMS